MFKWFMIISVTVLAMGWAAYWIWELVMRQKEKNEPKRTTEHLQKVKKSFEDYTEKMKDYYKDKKPFEREKKD